MTGPRRDGDGAMPLEEFIQAVQSQLDRAQSAMALKLDAGFPLTFAVKDLTLDLRAHVDIDRSAVRIRPAGPGDRDTSMLHLALTTITAPLMQENARPLAAAPDEPTLEEVLGEESEEDRRRLEWAGIHTVSQLRAVERSTGEAAIQRTSQLPVLRLRAALARASQPLVREVQQEPSPEPGDPGTMLRIRGRNLRRDALPEVRLDGRTLDVVAATEGEILVRSADRRPSGVLEIEPELGRTTSFAVVPDRPERPEPPEQPQQPVTAARRRGEDAGGTP